MIRQLRIDVFFDFICPWCLIGKRQLQAAIDQLQDNDPDIEVILHWRGVQLLPHLPPNGVAFKAFYHERLGGESAVLQRQAQVRQAAHAVGVDIHFDRISRMPNTAKAHRLFENALKVGTPEQCEMLLERLFSAYFHYSEDISDPLVLLNILNSFGFAEAIQNGDLDPEGFQQPFISANTGGQGVPYFVFNDHFALAGAHSADTLYKVMLEALARQGEVQ
ncbi:DsbA family oxidoreductase [Acinetobacter piscicola]|uniref:DsbA family oxidoreductase n=1 Tax=Acinetobacter piscicola TaxID=2006115 RepID=UPI000B7EF8B0|nr:DsbA family oxidoreductase [Acinetobacter piscicola]